MRWLHARAPLQENVLIRLPEADVAAIFAAGSGQQRVNELFRRAQRMRVSRTVVATVAMQDDYMKRVRGGGGARDQLRDEGIVIFGDYAGDQVLAAALGLPRPGPGEFVSARLVPRPAEPGDRVYARSIRLAGADWLLAAAADPAAAAPALPVSHGPLRTTGPFRTTGPLNHGPAEPQVRARPAGPKRLHCRPGTGIVWHVQKPGSHAIAGGASAGIRGRRPGAAPGRTDIANRRRNMRGFKNFLMRGDVIVVAVGLVVALAFSALITSFTADIINPIIQSFTGGKVGLGFQIRSGNPKTVVDIGAFISAIIYFVIFMAVVYFLIVVPYKIVQAQTRAGRVRRPAPVKTCPACLSTDLPAAASKCKYCGTDQPATA